MNQRISLTTRRPWVVVAGTAVIIIVLFGLFSQRERLPAIHHGPDHANGQDEFDGSILDNIHNRTLGFQKIFVISLPHRTDLRDASVLAAAFTGLDFEFVDGVYGENISEKALPPGAKEAHLNPGGYGAWRAHMNVARIIVAENIQSALVLENDADWDIRIKSQMRKFAMASRILLQPVQGTNDTFLDPTNPSPEGQDHNPMSMSIDDPLAKRTLAPTTSPYGDLDRWDLLWLGHCGCRFPWASDGNAPLGRAVINQDETVPERHHYAVELGDHQLLDQYPEHTRAVSRARLNSCSLGHAFSQQGARKFLYEVGLKKLDEPADMAFRAMCDGVRGRPLAICLTVQPQLFQHHRPRGPKFLESEIDDHGSEFNEHGYTQNVRWSTRVNFPRLIAGRTDYIDLYPDGLPGPAWPEDE